LGYRPIVLKNFQISFSFIYKGKYGVSSAPLRKRFFDEGGGGGGGGCLAIASQFGIFSAPAGRSENFFRIIQFTIFLI